MAAIKAERTLNILQWGLDILLQNVAFIGLFPILRCAMWDYKDYIETSHIKKELPSSVYTNLYIKTACIGKKFSRNYNEMSKIVVSE